MHSTLSPVSAELLVRGRPWSGAAGAEGPTASTVVQGTVAVTSRCSLGLTALRQSHSPPADAGLAPEKPSIDDAGAVLYADCIWRIRFKDMLQKKSVVTFANA